MLAWPNACMSHVSPLYAVHRSPLTAHRVSLNSPPRGPELRRAAQDHQATATERVCADFKTDTPSSATSLFSSGASNIALRNWYFLPPAPQHTRLAQQHACCFARTHSLPPVSGDGAHPRRPVLAHRPSIRRRVMEPNPALQLDPRPHRPHGRALWLDPSGPRIRSHNGP